MKLRRIAVDLMPGFEEGGFQYETLSEGVNVIWGPNGSGKTTSCKALRKLLWPDHPHAIQDMALSLRATLTWDGQGGEVVIQGRQPPILCGVAKAIVEQLSTLDPRCYTLSLDEMFDAHDSDLAARVAKEMFGGFDIASLRCTQKLPYFQVGTTEKSGRSRALRDKAEIIRRIQHVDREQEELHEINRHLNICRQAREELKNIEKALELHRAHLRVEIAEKRLTQFPTGMDKMRETDASDISKLLQEKEPIQKKRQVLLQEGAPDRDGLLSLVDMEELRGEIEECASLEREQATLECLIPPLQTQVDRLYERSRIIPEKLDTESLLALTPLIAEGYLQKIRAAAYQRQLERLGGISVENLDIRRTLLEAWQRHRRKRQSLAICVSCAVTAILFFRPVQQEFIMTFLGICALGICAGTIMCVYHGWKMWQLQKQYRDAELPVLSAWNKATVQKAHADIKNGQLLTEMFELGPRCQQAWDEIQHQIGTRLPLIDLSDPPFLFVSLNCYIDAAKIQREIEKLNAQTASIAQRISRIRAIAEGKFGCALCNSGAMRRVFSAMQARISLQERYAQRQEQLIECTQRWQQIETDVDGILARTASQVPEEVLVKQMQWHEYQDAMQEWRVAVQAREQIARDVGNHLQGHSAETLEQMRRDGEAQVEAHSMWAERKGRIEQKLQKEIHDRDLALIDASIREYDAKIDATQRSVRQELLRAWLLADIEEKFIREKQPAILTNANTFLQRFTQGIYEIKTEKGNEGAYVFSAYDSRRQRSVLFEALSRGTRLQLLLAVRLGFVTAQEKGGIVPPLVLDEALQCADDERLSVLLRALREIAHSGRQILYFTCQKATLGAWQDVFQQDPAFLVIDLSLMRGLRIHRALPPSPPIVQRIETPQPDDTLFAYATRLLVPAYDPTASPSTQHIAHFLDTPGDLYTFLLRGITTLGQAASLMRNNELLPSSPQSLALRERIFIKFHIAAELHQMLQIGRSKKVGTVALEQAVDEGILSRTFFSSIAQLTEELDGDGAKVLEALDAGKVKRFQKTKIADWREWMLREGYIDTRTPHSVDAIRAHLWRDASLQHLTQEEIHRYIEHFLQYIRNYANTLAIETYFPDSAHISSTF